MCCSFKLHRGTLICDFFLQNELGTFLDLILWTTLIKIYDMSSMLTKKLIKFFCNNCYVLHNTNHITGIAVPTKICLIIFTNFNIMLQLQVLRFYDSTYVMYHSHHY